MKVDRSKFLLVVGALSAATVVVASASCSSTSSTTNADAGSTGFDSGNDFDSGGSVGDDGGDAGTAACLGDLPDASVPDDAGDAGDGGLTGCAALTGGGCAAACDSIAQSFRAGLADDIRACLMPAPSCEGTTAVSTCVQAAMDKACPDTTATSACTPLVASCAGDDAGADAGDAGVVFDQTTCERVFRSLNSAGRDSFTTCITEGVAGHCTADPGFCVQQAQLQ